MDEEQKRETEAEGTSESVPALLTPEDEVDRLVAEERRVYRELAELRDRRLRLSEERLDAEIAAMRAKDPERADGAVEMREMATQFGPMTNGEFLRIVSTPALMSSISDREMLTALRVAARTARSLIPNVTRTIAENRRLVQAGEQSEEETYAKMNELLASQRTRASRMVCEALELRPMPEPTTPEELMSRKHPPDPSEWGEPQRVLFHLSMDFVGAMLHDGKAPVVRDELSVLPSGTVDRPERRT